MKLVEVAKVGDYVAYDALISEEKRYGKISREHMNWQVLKNDGQNIILISEKPTKSEICLSGAKGYMEGTNKLDKISNELYTSNIGKARNLKIEDVNELLGYKVDNVMAYYRQVKYGTKISELEKKFHRNLLHRKTPDTKDLGQYTQTYYVYWKDDDYKKNHTLQYRLIFGNDGKYSYWLSSSCVDAGFTSGFASFRMCRVDDSNVNADILYFSNGFSGRNEYSIRPIVILNSSVLVTNERTGGKTVDTAWKIQ